MPSRRPQLRRCRNCQKVGHNTSTCSIQATQKSKKMLSPATDVSRAAKKKASNSSSLQNKNSPSPLKFYVHHVSFEPRHSPHVVNLKQQKFNIWDQVGAASPAEGEESLYHFHHETTGTLTQQSQPSKSPEPSPLFVEFKHPEENFSIERTNLAHPHKMPKKEKVASWWSNFKESHQTKLAASKGFAQTKKISPAPDTTSLSQVSSSSLLNRYFSLFSFNKKQLPEKQVSFQENIPTPSLQERWQSFTASFSNGMILRKRLAFALTALLILSILPTQVSGYYYSLQQTKQTVTDQSTAGFMSLQESTAALLTANLPGAEESTVNALQNFNAAVNTLENNHQFLQKIISVVPVLKDEVQSRQELILAGQKISLGNAYLLKGLSTTRIKTGEKPTERLQIIINHLQAAVPNYEDALASLDRVKPDALPPEFQAPFKDFKAVFSAAVHDFKQLVALGQSFQEVFGGEGMRRYIIMFQNPDELRPTGGFTGSFAIIDIKDGELVKVDVPAGGTYDVQGQLDKYVEPPTPFLLFSTGYWQFHDANWFPDFRASAENTMWFYRHTGRGSVDGVISINSTFLTRLLTLTGPIQDEKRGITLTSENALGTLRSVIDTTHTASSTPHKPKQVLTDLTPQFVEYFKNLQPAELLPLLVNVKDALDQKEIQLYFADRTTEEKITAFGWGGTLTATTPTQDYLNVNMSNFNSGKTDARIEQRITHQVVVQDDGSVVNTVVITRKHNGSSDEPLYNQPNMAYFRIYVPEGSTLLQVSGVVQPDESAFHSPVKWAEKHDLLTATEKEIGIDKKTGTRITNEFGKTAFGNWTITKPGETSQVQISYKLPFKLFSPPATQPSAIQNILSSADPEIATYQLVLQKQSGITNNSFESQIIFPTNWRPLWNEGGHLDLATNGATISSAKITHDMIWSLAMQKKK